MRYPVAAIQEQKAPVHSSPFAKEGRQSFFGRSDSFFAGKAVQTKTVINQPSDQFEQQTDAATETVVQHKQQPVDSENKTKNNRYQQITQHNISYLQRKCAACEAEEDKKDDKLQRKETVDGFLTVAPPIEHKLNSSKGSGSPLPQPLNASMSNAIGADFSNVKIHTGSNAVQMSKDLNAQAFTHGNNIYFNEGKYNPESKEGQHLLAHELTHVIQQKKLQNDTVNYMPDIQCVRDYVSTVVGPLGSDDESGQRINLFTLYDTPIEVGAEQIYVLSFNPNVIPEGLSYHWSVIDNETGSQVGSYITYTPRIQIPATTPGSYLVSVNFRRDGEWVLTNTGGYAFLRINQRVGSELEESSDTDVESHDSVSPSGMMQSSLPNCEGIVIEVNSNRTFTLGQAPRPADNCSFSPVFHIGNAATSARFRIHSTDPPPGDWRMTIFECPVGFSDTIACDRAFGESTSDSGAISSDLNVHFDRIAWISRNVFIRIRNGSLSAIPNVILTIEPQFRDPLIQAIHDALSILGFIPGLGIIPDAVDTSIYLIEGDWGGAILSAAAMLPAFGDGATIVRRLGSRDVIRVLRSEVERLGESGIEAGIRRIRREAVSEGSERTGRSATSGIDLDIDHTIDAIIEEPGITTGPARRGRLRRPISSGLAEVARAAFERVRDGYAIRLGVPSGGQVHHAIELQILDRHPGVFTQSELNAFSNMRGIGTELLERRQLHNSSIRYHWNRHYRLLDEQITHRGLVEGTSAYNEFVRRYLETARDEIDYIMGQFFTEYRTGRARSYE
jgi:Domain of unknown function (DUF4157)